ncbi:AI-2E family transporter [Actinomarinicola tropica]|uniref:AI-2E family transporter n=1 Tax=Actinomarinicola tropica TaxID=2789776 RepID=A0A5Q2RC37_9ACTN|nr:AI-2E family transporter [Actinomarinicola tropica]QGG94449.1 AI-2E family transporter [Actinomarinicola tropica]
MPRPNDTAPGPRAVPPGLQTLASYGWRLIVVAIVGLGVLWALRQMWSLVLAVVVGGYIARALDPIAARLRARGVPPAALALACLLLFAAVVGGTGAIIGPLLAEELDTLGPTLTDAVDDVEEWLVEDSPLNLDRGDIDELRQEARDAISRGLRSSRGDLLSGALVVMEGIVGLILAVVATFFFLKDGPRFQRWALRRVASDQRDVVRRMGTRAWATLGGYLRGAAILGLVEGIAIGVTLVLVGAKLAIPVAVLTFAAAFVPIVGAVVAGIIAVLVALATAGFGAAVVTAIVAVVVQQLDGDLLAPIVYGRALQLHPLIVLFAVVAGGALFGIAGTILAVPLTAMVVAMASEAGIGGVRPDAAGEDPFEVVADD